jgi:hypothetical protein
MPPMERPIKNTVTKAKPNMPPLRGDWTGHSPQLFSQKFLVAAIHLLRFHKWIFSNVPELTDVAPRSSHIVTTVRVRDVRLSRTCPPRSDLSQKDPGAKCARVLVQLS